MLRIASLLVTAFIGSASILPASARDLTGWSAELAGFMPFREQIDIGNRGVNYGKSNLTGVGLCGATVYQLDLGGPVVGVRGRICGSFIESMPPGFIARDLGNATIGGRVGYNLGFALPYAFVDIGVGLFSLESTNASVMKAVQYYMVGGGVQIPLKGNVSAFLEGGYAVPGDFNNGLVFALDGSPTAHFKALAGAIYHFQHHRY